MLYEPDQNSANSCALEYLKECLLLENVAILGGAPIDYAFLQDSTVYVHTNLHYRDVELPRDILFTAATDEPIGLCEFEIVCVDGIGRRAQEWITWTQSSGAIAFVYYNQAYGKRNPHGIEQEQFSTFYKQLETKPFTGLVATKLALESLAEEIRLSGFTFYEKEDGRVPYAVGSHLIPNQMKWLDSQVRTESRLIVDRELSRILDANRPAEPNEIIRVTRIDNESFLIDDLN